MISMTVHEIKDFLGGSVTKERGSSGVIVVELLSPAAAHHPESVMSVLIIENG